MRILLIFDCIYCNCKIVCLHLLSVNEFTMINSTDFAGRLKIVMEYYDLSASLLAEKINIQRSSISHLLSGRNKPSLDFVLKILENFPEVELYWLLNGKGVFPKELIKIQEENIIENTKLGEDKSLQTNKSSEIDRIIIFFKDGTFKNYTS